MNVVKKAKFVLFFDTFIENQAKDFVSRLKNMKVDMYNYIFKLHY